MKSVLIITPCSSSGLPTQGEAIARRLAAAGVRVGILSKARSGLGRFLDVVFLGFFRIRRYDTVFVNVFGGRAFLHETAAILYATLWGKPSVIMLRGGWIPDVVRRWPRWARFAFARAGRVLVPHRYLEVELERLGVRIDGVIPNFVDLENYAFRKRSRLAPRLLYLRNMHTIYNPQMAIRAFKMVEERYPEASLTMAGLEGNESVPCQELARKLGVRNVRFVGQIPKRDVSRIAQDHDIYLHTNRVENMPVSVIEMWACGLPVVGTRVGGMPYLVRERLDGLLVDSNDHEAMADACAELLSNQELAADLSRNGRLRAEELTWARVKPAWEHVLLGTEGEAIP